MIPEIPIDLNSCLELTTPRYESSIVSLRLPFFFADHKSNSDTDPHSNP